MDLTVSQGRASSSVSPCIVVDLMTSPVSPISTSNREPTDVDRGNGIDADADDELVAGGNRDPWVGDGDEEDDDAINAKAGLAKRDCLCDP